MLETFNDYLSLGVLIFIVLFAIKILLASIRGIEEYKHKRDSVIFDYINNEDE